MTSTASVKQRATMTKSSDSLPLSGIRVLDLTRVRAGPTAVRQLADWGADVVKIEMPEGVEAGDPLGGPRHGSDFQNLQRNKRGMTLNLKDPRGMAVFRRLASEADVVVENFRPDVKDRLGLDYASLKALNPRIILASISGFGQDGPYRERPGFDQIAQGMGGLMSITGLPGQGPVRVGIPIADLTAGIFCSQGILLALIERQRSGIGQWVQTSLLQAQIFMLDFQAARWLTEGEVPKQAGNNHPTSIPTGVFETRDGYINIATTGQKIWERFCRAIDAEELISNPDYVNTKLRSANRDRLNAEIAAKLRAEKSDTWIGRLNEAGVPCGQIYSIDQVFSDPQVQHLEPQATIESPHVGKLTLLRQPMTLSRTPSRMDRYPPAVGEHTQEVLREAGFAPDDIAELARERII
jgi:crotonobetainyl-CoA:carnitine CoA-transferase CaiB-like acyl-CoA transferase